MRATGIFQTKDPSTATWVEFLCPFWVPDFPHVRDPEGNPRFIATDCDVLTLLHVYLACFLLLSWYTESH